MTITLTLNNRQVAMLHALFGEATTQNITDAIKKCYEEYLCTECNSAVTTAYERVIAYMNNHPTNNPFGDENIELFQALDDAMALIGRNFQNNEEKEN